MDLRSRLSSSLPYYLLNLEAIAPLAYECLNTALYSIQRPNPTVIILSNMITHMCTLKMAWVIG
jgi:hypothetical protein